MAFDALQYEICEDNIEFRLIAPDTWMLTTKLLEPFSSDCYLLSGDESAVIIDTGMIRNLNLKDYILELKLTDKPIIGAISTHSHFDHTGGNGWFGHAWMHKNSVYGATHPFGGNADGYILDYPIDIIKEGDVIDLGNRRLEFIEIGAHDLGSVAILDKDRRILFTGDELETGWINVGSTTPEKVPGQTIETHYKNMQKLKARYDEYDIICPGHHGAPIDKSSIDDFLKCDEMILSGVPGDPYVPRKNGGERFRSIPHIQVMRYRMAHICYRDDRIFEDK